MKGCFINVKLYTINEKLLSHSCPCVYGKLFFEAQIHLENITQYNYTNSLGVKKNNLPQTGNKLALFLKNEKRGFCL